VESIFLFALFIGVISVPIYFLRITLYVARNDPMFAFKSFVFGLVFAALGYVVRGHVEIKLMVWGVGGVVLYALYKLVKNEQ
jgi:hypothetical protein